MSNFSFDWTNIVLELSPRLLGYFAARFSRTQASDLTQETFLRLYLFVKQGHLDSSKGSLTMVAFGIARNVGLEFIRENIKHSHSVTEDLLQSFASNIESLNSVGNEETLALRQCILKLTPVQQDVLLLHLQEFSMEEISALTKISVNTVKSHIYRSKSDLKELLSNL